MHPDNHNTEDGESSSVTAVDIATAQTNNNFHHPRNNNNNYNNNSDSDGDDEFDIRKWTSCHYDTTSKHIMDDEAAERDLYDSKLLFTNINKMKKSKNTSSLFDDANNGGEGADEDGVFLR